MESSELRIHWLENSIVIRKIAIFSISDLSKHLRVLSELAWFRLDQRKP